VKSLEFDRTLFWGLAVGLASGLASGAVGLAVPAHTLQRPPSRAQFAQPLQFLQAVQTPVGLHFAATAGNVGHRNKSASAKRSTVDFMRLLWPVLTFAGLKSKALHITPEFALFATWPRRAKSGRIRLFAAYNFHYMNLKTPILHAQSVEIAQSVSLSFDSQRRLAR
jgi:hypothetical protein